MRTYEERARYILKQRDERLAKHRRIRTAVTLSAVSVCSLALIVGASVIINKVMGKNGAVWISTSGASSGVSSGASGTADPKEAALPAELIYDENKNSKLFEFTIPEFPDVNFKVEDYCVFADGKELYSGMPIFTVYLADLNGDGYRELCSEIALGSGMVDERIRVYDYANSKLYDLSDRGRYDYTLTLENGVLKYNMNLWYILDSSLEGHSPIETDILTLSMMKRVSFDDNGKELPPTEKLYPRDNSDVGNILELNDNFEFTIPELPDSSFKLVKGVLSCDGETLFQGYPIHSIYLADLNKDGTREICAEYSVGSGIVDMGICAYDPIAKELYKLLDTDNKEYVLTYENGILGYKHCVYSSSGIVTDEQGELTLSVMNKLCHLPKAPES